MAVVPASSPEEAVRAAMWSVRLPRQPSRCSMPNGWSQARISTPPVQNAPIRQELSEAAVRRCNVITVDSVPTALAEAGDLCPCWKKGGCIERQLLELGDVIIGRRTGARVGG